MLASNDPNLKSWVSVDESSDFPIQNLPFGVFRLPGKKPRVGIAIGTYVLDLARLLANGFFIDGHLEEKVFRKSSLNAFLSLGKEKCTWLRERVSVLLRSDNSELKKDEKFLSKVLVPQRDVEMLLPVRPVDYTDFYSSIEHATNVGTMIRGPENALMPNWKHLPVGYHGRSGSIIVSGEDVYRPKGQFKTPEQEHPSFGPSSRVDFELEMAFITCGSTQMGESISTDKGADHIFGFTLFNDWSARDIQTWEYVPLGPFLAKNFASSMSPWVVTMDALEPFTVPGPVQDPAVLPYLEYKGNWNFDIQLEVFIEPENGSENRVCKSNFKYMYWNVLQQLAHHTVNGCNINAGDVYASGTISGPTKESFGSMLELAWKGTKPLTLDDGSTRTFIQDYDTVIMRGAASNETTRIGFGEVRSKILPSK